MDKAIKNTISHRYKAIVCMKEYFSSQKRPISPDQVDDNDKKSKLEK